MLLLAFARPGAGEEFADAPQRLEPVRQRTETEQEYLQAATLVMEARILERRGELASAVRKYQRAWRLDPDARVVLKRIVPLALQLGRVDEATRYALLLTNSDLDDPFLAERMAMLMADQLEYDRSLQLYQHVLKLRADAPNTRDPIAMHFEMGRLYFLTGKHEQAAQSFRVVLDALENPQKHQLAPEVQSAILADPSLTYTLIAESFLEAGAYEDARGLFKKAADAKKPAGWLQFQMARVDYRAGRYKDALEKLEDYVQQKLQLGGRTPYQLLQGLLDRTPAADREKAAATVTSRFREWLTNDPENFPLLFYVADLMRSRGVLRDAADLYEKSLAANPTVEGYRGLISTYLGLRQEQKLLELLSRVAKEFNSFDLFAEEIDGVVNDAEMVQAILKRGREQISQQAADQKQIAVACGLLALRAEQYDVAGEFFKSLEWTSDQSELLVAWGLQLLMADRLQQAAIAFQTALDAGVTNENEAVCLYYLAGALELQGKTEEALDCATRAARLAKDIPEIQLRPAWILYNAGKTDEAKKQYTSWLGEYAEDYSVPGLRASVRDARFVMSNICLEEKQFEAAAEWLEQVLDEFPRDARALNDLGYLLADRNKSLGRAIKMIRLAVESEPESSAYRDSLGWALFRMGEFDSAVEQLQQAASDEPPDPVILDHLAEALLAAGDGVAAAETWRRALSLLADTNELKANVERKLGKLLAESD